MWRLTWSSEEPDRGTAVLPRFTGLDGELAVFSGPLGETLVAAQGLTWEQKRQEHCWVIVFFLWPHWLSFSTGLFLFDPGTGHKGTREDEHTQEFTELRASPVNQLFFTSSNYFSPISRCGCKVKRIACDCQTGLSVIVLRCRDRESTSSLLHGSRGGVCSVENQRQTHRL